MLIGYFNVSKMTHLKHCILSKLTHFKHQFTYIMLDALEWHAIYGNQILEVYQLVISILIK